MMDRAFMTLSPVGSAAPTAPTAPTAPAAMAGVAPAQGAAPVEDFGSVMASLASDAVATIRSGEALSISGIKGGASVQQVVEGVMAAEQTLQTTIAIRDKVVAAYLEISRMSI